MQVLYHKKYLHELVFPISKDDNSDNPVFCHQVDTTLYNNSESCYPLAGLATRVSRSESLVINSKHGVWSKVTPLIIVGNTIERIIKR